MNSPKSTSAVYCAVCNLHVQNFYAHQRTDSHKSKSCLQSDIEGVLKVHSTFKNRIASYRIPATDHLIDYEEFLSSVKCKVQQVLQRHLHNFKAVKVNMEVFGLYYLASSDEYSVKSFNSRDEILTLATNIDTLYDHFQDALVTKAKEFNENKSGR